MNTYSNIINFNNNSNGKYQKTSKNYENINKKYKQIPLYQIFRPQWVNTVSLKLKVYGSC